MSDNIFNSAQQKIAQFEHRQILQANRNKEAEIKLELRRKVLLGEMFLKHFPIALEFTPGKSSDEDARILELLDNFMESLSQSQQSYQLLEDAMLQFR